MRKGICWMMSHFVRNTLVLLSMICFSISGNAQQFYASSEYGMKFGAGHYFGDINPNYGLKRPMPAIGAFFRHHFNPYISTRASMDYTILGYSDNLSKNAYQQQRNLSFNSNILEVALMAEFNFFWFSTGDPLHRFTPYLAGGIGAFYYEPTTRFEGHTYKLRLLGTEGQFTEAYKDRRYQPFSICFPIGFGFKYWVRPGLNLGFELINRFTLTDYIDDVSTTYVGSDKFANDPMHPTAAAALQDRSLMVNGQKLGRAGKQRGNDAFKDQYLFAQLTLSFQLKTYKCPSHLDGVWEP